MNIELLDSAPFVSLIVKATVLLLAACVVALLLTRKSAALRHLVWLCCAAGLFALPVFSIVLPAWNVAVADRAVEVPDERIVVDEKLAAVADDRREVRSTGDPFADRVSAGADVAEPAVFDTLAPQPAAASTPAPDPAVAGIRETGKWSRSFWIGLWLVGTALLLLVRLAGEWRIRRVRSGCCPAESLPSHSALVGAFLRHGRELGMNSRPELLIHPSLALPFTCGIWRCAIVLPESAVGWEEEKLRAILLHELGHVKRRDCLTQWIGHCAWALFWFHPLAWWMTRQLQVEREKACDDLVVAAGEAPSRYSRVLLDLATGIDTTKPLLPRGVLAMARKSTLEGRLLALLDPRRSRTGLNRAAVVTTLGMFALMVIPLAMLRASSAESSDVVADSLGLPSGFVLVDDFQEYGPRNVLEFFGADSWVPYGMSGTHWVQEEDDNYFLATGHHLPRGISRKLPDGLTIGGGERATWFFRLRLQSDSIDQASLGLATDPRLVRNAGDWDRAGVMARLDRSQAGDGYELKVWDARENRMERIAEIESDVWYNLWFVLDRGETNAFAVYLTEGRENASRSSRLFFGDSLESEVNRFSFREGLTADSILNYVMFMAMDTTGNSLHIADIWMDPSGANLKLPVKD